MSEPVVWVDCEPPAIPHATTSFEWQELVSKRDLDGLFALNHSLYEGPGNAPSGTVAAEDMKSASVFTGDIVISPTRSDIAKIMYDGATQYWISAKSDGGRLQIRFWLTPSVNKHDPPHYNLIFINRSGRVFRVKHGSIPAPPDFFKGTFLDGDLTWNKQDKCFEYHIYNLVQSKGVNHKNDSYGQRMQIAQNLINAWYYMLVAKKEPVVVLHDEKKDTLQSVTTDAYARFEKRWVLQHANYPIRFWVKPIFPLCQAEWVLDSYTPRLRSFFELDGYILTPENVGSERGFNRRLIKWKISFDPDVPLESMHTVEFELVFTSSDLYRRENMESKMYMKPREEDTALFKMATTNLICCLYTYDFTETSTTPVCFAAVQLPSSIWKDAWGIKDLIDLQHKIVECWYESKQNLWHIKQLRPDRKSANALRTVLRTLENARDALSRTDVLPFLALSTKTRESRLNPHIKNGPPSPFMVRDPFVYRHFHSLTVTK